MCTDLTKGAIALVRLHYMKGYQLPATSNLPAIHTYTYTNRAFDASWRTGTTLGKLYGSLTLAQGLRMSFRKASYSVEVQDTRAHENRTTQSWN